MTRAQIWFVGLTLLVVWTLASYALGHTLSGDAEVRISARKLADGRVEFALQQRVGGEWGERQLPRARFFPANPGSANWRNSSALQVETAPDSEPTANEPATEPTVDESSTLPPIERAECGVEPGAWGTATIASLANAYRRVAGVWSGFNPNDIPAIVNYRSSSGEISTDAVALNLPAPQRLGIARPLSTTGTPFESLHCLTDLTDEAHSALQKNTHFDLSLQLPGQTVFAMIASVDSLFLYDPVYPFFASTFMHEMFHDYQFRNWVRHPGRQDFENYPLEAWNIELAALEDQALRAAINADNPEARLRAARHFAALRSTGLKRDIAGILHGEQQEHREGSAAYIEHRIEIGGGGIQETPTGALVQTENMSNFAERVRDLDEVMSRDWVSVRPYYSFERFYRSGAAILHLLDLLGVNPVQSQVNQGMSPAEVMIAYLNVTPEEAEQLMSEARSTYNPDGLLRATAVRAAAEAANDPWTGPGGG